MNFDRIASYVGLAIAISGAIAMNADVFGENVAVAAKGAALILVAVLGWATNKGTPPPAGPPIVPA